MTVLALDPIDELTQRLHAGLPHPRTEALQSAAEQALRSQAQERRTPGQWARDLAPALAGVSVDG